jgi:hypothetical protein
MFHVGVVYPTPSVKNQEEIAQREDGKYVLSRDDLKKMSIMVSNKLPVVVDVSRV